MKKKHFEIHESLGIILFALGFFLVEGIKDKLILGFLIFFYMGLSSFWEMKGEHKMKNILLYQGCIFIFLGLFALGLAFLMPNYPDIFGILFGIMIFLEFIILYLFGYKGLFKNILFILFSFPLIWAIYSLFTNFFYVGIRELKIPEIILAVLAILGFILIYWAVLSFFNKILPQNKVTSHLMSNKGIFYFLLLLALLIVTGFLWKEVSISFLDETINRIPYLSSILNIIGFLSLFNFLFPKK